MRPGKRWYKSSTQLGLVGIDMQTLPVGVSIEVLFNEAWQTLVYGGSAQWGLVGIGIESLLVGVDMGIPPNEAWLHWYKSSA